ncbi:MAG: FmdB family zinc ribbon protein [Candidatus Thorarchaeota archaeon]|jgi:putative FmdB family regulatory protein
MPIYELVCINCDHHFEFLQLRKDEKVPQRCPKCRHKLERSYEIGLTCQYKRGKNPNWPLTETVQDTKPSGKEYD